MAIDTRKNIAFQAAARARIAKLRVSRDFRRPLTDLPIRQGQEVPGVVRQEFIYAGGDRKVVRLHAKVMVALLKAMLKAKTIEVTATSESKYSGSFRTWAQQAELYSDYQNGSGHMAARPGFGYHQTGRAFDGLEWSERERDAMESVRVSGLRFHSGEVFGDPPHYSFGAVG